MLIMYMLRMLADLSFYYAFAGVISNACNGNMPLVGAAILVIAFGICAVNGQKGLVRFAGLLVSLVFFLLPGLALADVLCYLPALAYVIYTVVKQDFTLSWYRAKDLFSLFWKLYIVFFAALLIYGRQWIVSGDSLPAACLMVFSSVLFMRALRHEEEIYLQKNYQIRSFLSVGILWLAAWLLSRRFVLRLLGTGLRSVYEIIFLPVLQAVMTAFVQVCYWIFSAIVMLLPDQGTISDTARKILGEMAQGDSFAETEQMAYTSNHMWSAIFFLVAILAIAGCAVLFFRWISSGRWQENDVSDGREQTIIPLDTPKSANTRRTISSHHVQQVRELYKRYLKLYMKLAGEIHPYETSYDIARKSEQIMKEHEEIFQIREIYLDARYNGHAEKKNLRTLKNLYQRLKKEQWP